MRIVKLEFIPIKVMGSSTFRISKGETQVVQSVIVKIETDNGLTGIGEIVSCPPGYPEEIQEEIIAALSNYIKPNLIGENPDDIPSIRKKLDNVLNERYWTKAAVINALYDLAAKAKKKSLCELIGGVWQETVPNIGGIVGLDTPENMVKKALGFTEKGAKIIKLKIGDTVEADIARVKAVRCAVGTGVGIRVDANSHYQAQEAVLLINKLEKYDLLHVEAPLDKHDILGMAKVKQSVGIPIMSDESVRIPIEAENLIKLNAVDIIKLKITKMGFDIADEILRIARDNGKNCILGHIMEMGIAGTAEAHFAMAHPELIKPHEIGSYHIVGASEDIIMEPVDSYLNCFSLHKGYGLGVTLNQKSINKMTVDMNSTTG